MDALKHVLRWLRLEPRLFYRLELAAPWGMLLTVSHSAAFHLVEQGECSLRISGSAEAIRLREGDLIVVSNVSAYEILDHPQGDSIPLKSLLQRRDASQMVRMNATSVGDSTTLICGEFRAEYGVVYPVFSLLPPLIVVPNEQGQAAEWLTTALKFITAEVKEARPGSDTVVSRLMDILFIMVVRYWIDHQPTSESGWLGALYHPQLGEVLGLMHRHPEQHWTVDSLATSVNLSRSTLAALFTSLVGESPMKYLTRWRMQVAVMLLHDDYTLTVEQVAARVGYTSAYAFSKAFKRIVGIAPSGYRRQVLEKDTLETEPKTPLL